MIAVCFARAGKCRSMQLTETFSVPSSNHLMNRLSGSHETFFTFVNGLIQSMRRACSRQKLSGSCSDCAYIVLYLAALMRVRLRHSSGTGMSVSVMAVSSNLVVVGAGPRRIAPDGGGCFGKFHGRFHRAPRAFGRVFAQREEIDGLQMRIGQHFVERVGAHDGHAVFLAEFQPFLRR